MTNQPSELGILSHQAIHHTTRWNGGVNKEVNLIKLEDDSAEISRLLRKIDNGELNIESSAVVYNLGMTLSDLLFRLLIVSASLKIDIKVAYDQFLARKEQDFKKNGYIRDRINNGR